MKMKKTTPLFLLLVVLIVSYTSCDLNNIKPPDNKTDRLKWTYSVGDVYMNSLPNPVPAIDEKSNIYAIVSSHSKDDFVKLDQSGKKVWSKNGNGISSRLIYSNNKLFYSRGTSIACADAETGTELWSTENAINGNIIAVTNDRIYTTDYLENNFLGVNYLKAFNLDGNLVWETKIKYSDSDSINFPFAMSINGNDIYIGVLAEIGKSNFAILKYRDTGDNAKKIWNWLAPEDFTTEGVNGRFKDIAIDDNSNLLFAMTKDSKQYVFSISALGNQNWISETNQNIIISNLSVDTKGNVFSSFSTIEKTGANGSIWNTKLKKDWEFEGLAANAPVLSDEGNSISMNFSKLLTAIDNNGKILWEQHYEPEEDTGLSSDEQFHSFTLNRNGDIIVVCKFEIKCFKGDNSGLLKGGWPKLYGNYGNTASK